MKVAPGEPHLSEEVLPARKTLPETPLYSFFNIIYLI